MLIDDSVGKGYESVAEIMLFPNDVSIYLGSTAKVAC